MYIKEKIRKWIFPLCAAIVLQSVGIVSAESGTRAAENVNNIEIVAGDEEAPVMIAQRENIFSENITVFPGYTEEAEINITNHTGRNIEMSLQKIENKGDKAVFQNMQITVEKDGVPAMSTTGLNVKTPVFSPFIIKDTESVVLQITLAFDKEIHDNTQNGILSADWIFEADYTEPTSTTDPNATATTDPNATATKDPSSTAEPDVTATAEPTSSPSATPSSSPASTVTPSPTPTKKPSTSGGGGGGGGGYIPPKATASPSSSPSASPTNDNENGNGSDNENGNDKDDESDSKATVTDENGNKVTPDKVTDTKGDGNQSGKDEDRYIVTLPEDKDLESGEQYNVHIKDEDGNPRKDVEVVLKDHKGNVVSGFTDENGNVILPPDGVIIGSDHKAYINGYEDDTFRPENSITRAETAVMLSRIFDIQPGDIEITYTDMERNADSEWYYDAVMLMSSAGMLTGDDVGTFRPNDTITREEFVTILERENATSDVNTTVPPDVTPDRWSYEYIIAALNAGYINGYEDGTFRPAQAITRGETVKILNTILGRNDFGAVANPFCDVDTSYWAYNHILEAAVNHNIVSGSNITDIEVGV